MGSHAGMFWQQGKGEAFPTLPSEVSCESSLDHRKKLFK